MTEEDIRLEQESINELIGTYLSPIVSFLKMYFRCTNSDESKIDALEKMYEDKDVLGLYNEFDNITKEFNDTFNRCNMLKEHIEYLKYKY